MLPQARMGHKQKSQAEKFFALFLQPGHSPLYPILWKEVKGSNEKWQQEEKAPKSN